MTDTSDMLELAGSIGVLNAARTLITEFNGIEDYCNEEEVTMLTTVRNTLSRLSDSLLEKLERMAAGSEHTEVKPWPRRRSQGSANTAATPAGKRPASASQRARCRRRAAACSSYRHGGRGHERA